MDRDQGKQRRGSNLSEEDRRQGGETSSQKQTRDDQGQWSGTTGGSGQGGSADYGKSTPGTGYGQGGQGSTDYDKPGQGKGYGKGGIHGQGGQGGLGYGQGQSGQIGQKPDDKGKNKDTYKQGQNR